MSVNPKTLVEKLIKDSKGRNRLAAATSVLALFTVLITVGALTFPAISLSGSEEALQEQGININANNEAEEPVAPPADEAPMLATDEASQAPDAESSENVAQAITEDSQIGDAAVSGDEESSADAPAEGDEATATGEVEEELDADKQEAEAEIEASKAAKAALKDADLTSARLIVGTPDAATLADETNVVANFDNVYLLQYDNADEAAEGFLRFYDHAEYVTPDVAVAIADGEDNSDPEEAVITTNNVFTEEDNPFAELETALVEETTQAVTNAAASNQVALIALIDTGATIEESKNVLEAVSVIGDDATDENGHGDRMVRYIVEENAEAQIISIKALGEDGRGDVSAVIAAINYAIERGANIINLSASAYASEENAALADAVKRAESEGIVVVGAAGNQGFNAKYYIPGNIDEATIVGAADAEGNRIEKSNFGETVDYNVVAGSTSEAAARMSGFVSAKGEAAIAGALNQGLIFETGYVAPAEEEAAEGEETEESEEAEEDGDSEFVVADWSGEPVTDWATLKDILENYDGEIEITISGTLEANGSIEIGPGKTVSITGGTIKGAGSQAIREMFRVSGADVEFNNTVFSGENLNLDTYNGSKPAGAFIHIAAGNVELNSVRMENLQSTRSNTAPIVVTDASGTATLTINEGSLIKSNSLTGDGSAGAIIASGSKTSVTLDSGKDKIYVRENSAYYGAVSVRNSARFTLEGHTEGNKDGIISDADAGVMFYNNTGQLAIIDISGKSSAIFNGGKLDSNTTIKGGVNDWAAPIRVTGGSAADLENTCIYKSTNAYPTHNTDDGDPWAKGLSLTAYVTDAYSTENGKIDNQDDVRYSAWFNGPGSGSGQWTSNEYWTTNHMGRTKMLDENARNTSGAILVDGSEVTLAGKTKIDDNKADVGAITIIGGGTLNQNDSATISNNLGFNAGAVSVIDGVYNFNDGELSGNHGWWFGTVNLSNDAAIMNMGATGGEPTIKGNFTLHKGGGIYINSNNANLVAGTIFDNTAYIYGGGIYVEKPKTLVLKDAAIKENEAKTLGVDDSVSSVGWEMGHGGGYWSCATGDLVFDSDAVMIYENTATNYQDDKKRGGGQDFFAESGSKIVSFKVSEHLAHDDVPGDSWVNERDDHESPQAFQAGSEGLWWIDPETLEQGGFTDLSLWNRGWGWETRDLNNHIKLTISDNQAPNGGGIASNGYMMFTRENKANASGVLTVQKAYGQGVQKEDVRVVVTILDPVDERIVSYDAAVWTKNDANQLQASIMLDASTNSNDGTRSKEISLPKISADSTTGKTVLEELNVGSALNSIAEFNDAVAEMNNWKIRIEEFLLDPDTKQYTRPAVNAYDVNMDDLQGSVSIKTETRTSEEVFTVETKKDYSLQASLTNVLKSTSVTIEKVDNNGEGLRGATFQLYRAADDAAIGEPQTNVMGSTFTWDNLTEGDYYLVETSAPAGYLPFDGKIYFTVEPDEQGSLHALSKGIANIGLTSAGTLTIGGKELKATGLGDHQSIMIDGTGTIPLYIQTKQGATITDGSQITETTTADDNFYYITDGEGHYLQGRTVTTSKDADLTRARLFVDDRDPTRYLDNRGDFKWDCLVLDDGSKVLKCRYQDANAPSSYIMIGGSEVRLTQEGTTITGNDAINTISDGTIVLQVSNEPITFDVEKLSFENKATKLPNVTFTIRPYNSSFTTSATTNENGVATFEKVKPGTYLLFETHASTPTGYVHLDTDVPITVNPDGTVTVITDADNVPAGAFQPVFNFDLVKKHVKVLDNGIKLQITNDEALYNYTLKKVDNTADHKPLKDAVFKLYKLDGETIKYATVVDGKTVFEEENIENAKEYKSADKTGLVTFEGLKAGTYYIVETGTPTGYDDFNSVVSFTIALGGAKTYNGTASNIALDGNLLTIGGKKIYVNPGANASKDGLGNTLTVSETKYGPFEAVNANGELLNSLEGASDGIYARLLTNKNYYLQNKIVGNPEDRYHPGVNNAETGTSDGLGHYYKWKYCELSNGVKALQDDSLWSSNKYYLVLDGSEFKMLDVSDVNDLFVGSSLVTADNLGDGIDLQIANEEKRYGVNIKKTAEDGTTLLNGATFRLYRLNAANQKEYAAYATNGSIGWVEDSEAEGVIRTTDKGLLSFSQLLPNTYYVEEVTAPTVESGNDNNYIKYDGIASFTIAKDGKKTFNGVASAISVDSNSGCLLIGGNKIYANPDGDALKNNDGNPLTLSKTEYGPLVAVDASGEPIKSLEGVTELYARLLTNEDYYLQNRVAGEPADENHPGVNNNQTNTSNGLDTHYKWTYSELANGAKVLQSGNKMIALANTLKLVSVNDTEGVFGSSGAITALDADGNTLTSEKNLDTIQVKNQKKGYLVLEKFKDDGTTHLEGAQLELVDAETNELVQLVNASTGEAIPFWESTDGKSPVFELPLGDYILREKDAPEGYLFDVNKEVSITEDNTTQATAAVATMKDKADTPQNVEVVKTDAKTGAAVPGAKLAILDSNGKLVQLSDMTNPFVSGGEPITIKGLAPGQYQLVEREAPLGYQLTSEVVTFTVRYKNWTNHGSLSNENPRINYNSTYGTNDINVMTLVASSDRSRMNVAYCVDKSTPGSGTNNATTGSIDLGSGTIDRTTLPSAKHADYIDRNREKIKRALYFGYPNDAAGFLNDATISGNDEKTKEQNFYYATQLVIWDYTNGSDTAGNQYAMYQQAQKLLDSDIYKKLKAIADDVNSEEYVVPDDFKISIYKSGTQQPIIETYPKTSSTVVVTMKNTRKEGELVVEKRWVDADGNTIVAGEDDRLSNDFELAVVLMRKVGASRETAEDDTVFNNNEAQHTQVLTASNDWKCSFTNLEIMKSEGTNYYYYVVEKDTGEAFEYSGTELSDTVYLEKRVRAEGSTYELLGANDQLEDGETYIFEVGGSSALHRSTQEKLIWFGLPNQRHESAYTSQQWIAESAGNGTFYLRSVADQSKYIYCKSSGTDSSGQYYTLSIETRTAGSTPARFKLATLSGARALVCVSAGNGWYVSTTASQVRANGLRLPDEFKVWKEIYYTVGQPTAAEKSLKATITNKAKEFDFELIKVDKRAIDEIQGALANAADEAAAKTQILEIAGKYNKLSDVEFKLIDRTTKKDVIANLKSDENGVIKFEKIKAGEYTLIETKQHPLYEQTSGLMWYIDVSAAGKVTVKSAFAENDGTDAWTAQVDNLNIAALGNAIVTAELPATGGIGTYVFVVAGILLMVVAGALFVRRNRRAQATQAE